MPKTFSAPAASRAMTRLWAPVTVFPVSPGVSCWLMAGLPPCSAPTKNPRGRGPTRVTRALLMLSSRVASVRVRGSAQAYGSRRRSPASSRADRDPRIRTAVPSSGCRSGVEIRPGELTGPVDQVVPQLVERLEVQPADHVEAPPVPLHDPLEVVLGDAEVAGPLTEQVRRFRFPLDQVPEDDGQPVAQR